MSDTLQRDTAAQVADKDFGKALALARAIKAPWFRCQALATVARYAPEGEVARVAEQAVSAAFSADDPYQTVAGSAWPLRALIERGQRQKVTSWLPKLLIASEGIANPVSRLDALYLLWQAVHPAGDATSQPVLEALVAACFGADSWKAGRTLRDATLIVAQEDAGRASRLIARMPEGAYKRQTQRRVAAGEPGDVRPFFWGR